MENVMTIPIHDPPTAPSPGAPEELPDEQPDQDPERHPDIPPLRIIEPDRGPPAIVAATGAI